jgi:hypothetical protein
MAEARRLEAWDHTAYLAATVMNLLRAKGRRAVAPAELNPYRRAEGGEAIDLTEVGGLSALKGRFVKAGNRQ